MKKKISYILFVLTLSSCTSNLYFNVLEPAQSPLPSNIKNVLIGVVYEEKPTIEKKVAVGKLIYHLRGNLMSTPRYNVLNDADLFPILNKDLLINDSLTILEVLESNSADAMILISNAEVKSRMNRIENFQTYEDEYGNLTTSKSYVYSALLNMSSNFIVNDGNSYTNISNFKSSHIEQLQSYNPITNGELIQGYNVLSYKLVRDYHNKVSPQWKEITREYYSTGSEKLIEASNLVKLDKIDEAILIWKSLTKNEPDKVKAKACFNMAVASEIKGSYNLAFDWLNHARRLGCKKVSDYETELRKQHEVAKKVDNQFTR